MRTEIRERLRELGLRPSKRLGQNFLADEDALDAIADAVRHSEGPVVVEIGPGLGAVTDRLVGPDRRLVALEVDHRLAEYLATRYEAMPSVEILDQDVLTFDFSTEFPEERVVVYGSVPYSLTAPILKHLVAHRACIREAVLLTQKEVAVKIAASPGKQGTPLGILVSAYADVEILREVGRSSFVPSPDVDSTLWRIRFLDQPRFRAAPDAFFHVVRAIYRMRRKMLRRALQDVVSVPVADVLEAAGIEGTLRGETLDFAQLDRLAHACAPFLGTKTRR